MQLWRQAIHPTTFLSEVAPATINCEFFILFIKPIIYLLVMTIIAFTGLSKAYALKCIYLSEQKKSKFVSGFRTRVCGTENSEFRSIELCVKIDFMTCIDWYNLSAAKCRKQLDYGCSMDAKAIKFGGCVGAEYEKLAEKGCKMNKAD